MKNAAIHLLVIGSLSAFGYVVGWTVRPPLNDAQPTAIQSPAPTNVTMSDTETGATQWIAELERLSASDIDPMELERMVFENIAHLSSGTFPAYLEALNTSKSKRTRSYLGMIFGMWAEVDVDAARKWAMLQSPAMKRYYIGNMAGAWARKDPDGVMDWFDSLAPKEKSDAASDFSWALTQIGMKDPRRVADWVLAQGNYLSTLEVRHAFENWAKIDTVAALQRASEIPGGERKSAAYSTIIGVWTKRDPASARQWLDKVTDQALLPTLQAAYANGINSTDARAAVNYISDLPLTKNTENMLKSAVQAWARNSPDEALGWADSLQDEHDRQRVYDAVFSALANDNPAKAAQLLISRTTDNATPTEGWRRIMDECRRKGGYKEVDRLINGLPEEFRETAATAMVRGLTSGSEPFLPLENWALTRTEGSAREAALVHSARVRYQRDGEAVADWLKALPDGASRERAAAAAARAAFYHDADVGVRIAFIMKERRDAVALISERVSYWKDRAEAKKWVRQTNAFTAEEMKEFFSIE